MSLSKVYPSNINFEPEDIVADTAPGYGTFTDISSRQRSPAQGPPPAEAAGTSFKEGLEVPLIAENTAKEPADLVAMPQENATVLLPESQAGVLPEVVEEMVAKAYEEGIQAGREQADEDYGTAGQSLLQVCEQLDDIRETILRNSLGEIQNLVMAISEKVVRHSLREQSRTILATIQEAIEKAVKSDEFQVFVNPEDYQVVNDKSTELVTKLNGLTNLTIRTDSEVERGGCRIESENCTVDATIVSQLQMIGQQLKNQD